jgi:hypothetical protein
LLEIRAAVVGQVHVLEYMQRPLLFLRGVYTNGSCGSLIVFMERWSIKLRGGRLPEIRTAAVGQAHMPEYMRRPLLFLLYNAYTNGVCPASANPLICGANRTIITRCIYKLCTPPSSCNSACPARLIRYLRI